MTTVSSDDQRALFERQRVFIKQPEHLRRRFATYYTSLALRRDVIFYESMSGARMMDNPYAIFLEIYHDPRYAGHTHVWSVAAFETIPEAWRGLQNVTFVTRHTDAYLRSLASAGHVICNSALPEYFVRRSGQKYLNTWHGIAYKQIGRSAISPLGGGGGVYNMMQATHVLTPCSFMTRLQVEGMSMLGVHAGQVAEVGYPRIDRTLRMDEEAKRDLRDRLRLRPGKRVVLYAPTWRGAAGSLSFDVERLNDDLDAMSRLDADIVFMGHHIMMRQVKDLAREDVRVAPSSVNTNELLAVVDVLVTDYSSIFFDFLVTGRPIVHYMYDYDEYRTSRGLNLDLQELPGDLAFNRLELIEHLQRRVSSNYEPGAGYELARRRFCSNEDGQASRRAAEWFFAGDCSGVTMRPRSGRRSVAYWGGRLDGSDAAVRFVSEAGERARQGNEDVVLIVARSVQRNQAVMREIRAIGDRISLVARNSHGLVATEAEAAAMVGSVAPGSSEAMLRRDAYVREYRRILGPAVFDESIVYDGATPFWSELAQYASGAACDE